MFFQTINRMITAGTDLSINIRQVNDKLTVAVMPRRAGLKDEAGEQIVPLSVADYLEHADALDNLDPQPTLREWFRPATEEEAFRLRLELAYILGRQGREPNDVIHMYVMKESG